MRGFISYRRSDTNIGATFVKEVLKNAFGGDRFFVDADNIGVGEFGKTIDHELANTDVLIVLVGAYWLKFRDENDRRFIDRKDDWVRREIRTAIRAKKPIVTILVGKETKPLSKDALPNDIAALAGFQSFPLTVENWRTDVEKIIAELQQLGFRKRLEHHYFPPKDLFTPALDEQQLNAACERLPHWRIERANHEGLEGQELARCFQFKSFKRAMDFMAAAVPYISEAVHHPRWENQWRTVNIWLTTWDIEHRISLLDVQLAEYFERLYEEHTKPRKT